MPTSIEHLEHGFLLGAWRVEPLRNRLLPPNGRAPIDIEPRVMRVLVTLASEAPAVMTRDTLMERVWTGTIVTDDALTRCISGIRKAFGDDRIIETVPRVGYALTVAPNEGALHRPEPTKSRTVVRFLVPTLVVLMIMATAFILGSIVVQQKPLTAVRPVPLGAQSGLESWPAWSPEGARLAFVHSESAGEPTELYVMRPGDTEPIQLTRLGGQVRSPEWDAPTDRLVFLLTLDGECTIQSVPALGGPPKMEGTCLQGFGGLALSPDGHLLVTAQPDSTSTMTRIQILDRTTGQVQTVANPDPESSDYFPRFSPEGERILFARTMGEGRSDVFEYNLLSGRTEPLTRGLSSLSGADWTPDESSLILSERDGFDFLLWQFNLRTKERTYLGTTGMHPRTRPSDGAVVFTQMDSDADVHTQEGVVCSSSRNDRQPVWRPGAHDLAFVSERDGKPGIYLCDPESNRVQAILTGSRAPDLVNGLTAGPDGRLAFSALSGSYVKVFVLDRDSGTARQLTTGSGNDVYPTWSADGAWIYFGSDRSGGFTLWRAPVGGGEAEQVSTEPALRARVSMQDGTVYFIPDDGSAIYSTGPDGGPSERMIAGSGIGFIPMWDLDGSAIVFRSPGQAGGVFERFDPATGRTTPFMDLGPDSRILSFSLSPDGHGWAVSVMARLESDLVLLQ